MKYRSVTLTAFLAAFVVGGFVPYAEVRAQDDVAALELKKWAGAWECPGFRLNIKGDKFSWVEKGQKSNFGITIIIKNVNVQKNVVQVDLLNMIEGNPNKGMTCKVIFRLEGETLHYCGTYGPKRPTEFKGSGSGLNEIVYVAWKRLKK
jgi:uncharacterized protein (TIGR03067 family)